MPVQRRFSVYTLCVVAIIGGVLYHNHLAELSAKAKMPKEGKGKTSAEGMMKKQMGSSAKSGGGSGKGNAQLGDGTTSEEVTNQVIDL